MSPLEQIERWPVDRAAAAIVLPDREPVLAGDTGSFRLASLSKPMTAWAIMIGVEEGIVDLDAVLTEAVDRDLPAGVTLRHLLAHAGGFPFDGEPVGIVEGSRIYSNTGFEVAARVLATAAAMPFADYLRMAVFEPLGMDDTELSGSPAHGAVSTIADTARFVAEMLAPRLIAPTTHREITSVHYADLGGIVPGVGRFSPCPWGLGVEIHGDKSPHWMGGTNSPAAFGHFGGSGTMMWADPDYQLGAVALTDRPFEQWADEALNVWPQLSDAIIAHHG